MLNVLIFGALAVIAGALADKAEKRVSFLGFSVFIVVALGFCGLALWAGLSWALQFKGVV